MHARAVPVALDWLVLKRHGHPVLLGDPVKEPTRYPKMVSADQRIDGLGRVSTETNLELPLPGHNLGIGSEKQQTCLEARIHVTLDDLATVSHRCAY